MNKNFSFMLPEHEQLSAVVTLFSAKGLDNNQNTIQYTQQAV